MSNKQNQLEDAIAQMLAAIEGDACSREGLQETPSRAAKAWMEWTSGYDQKPEDILKEFKDGAENYDELVIVKDCPVMAFCEHHMAPFTGVAHVGYIPDKRIVGLSKIPRLVDMYARRLQVQERMTTQIADALETHLKPRGVAVVLQCSHSCMSSRGIKAVGSVTTTSAMRGLLMDDHAARAEFLRLIKL